MKLFHISNQHDIMSKSYVFFHVLEVHCIYSHNVVVSKDMSCKIKFSGHGFNIR